MSICAPKPFGSKFLKGGYSYWPLWWYGQKDKLHDMSGHGVTLYPSGAYFNGQGYYFDGVDDYLIDDYGRKIIYNGSNGVWYSIYLTNDEVPAEGSVRGTGTLLRIAPMFVDPRLTGKIVLHPEHCPNLENFSCQRNHLSFLDVSEVVTLVYLYCRNNHLSFLDVTRLTSLTTLWCNDNYFSFLDLSTLTLLKSLECHNNSMDQSAVDTVLCDMDSHGTSGGHLTIQGNAAPSATGVACKDNLVARGWSVTTD